MSTKSSIVADRYAKALLTILGEDQTQLDQIDDELDMVGRLLVEDPRFADFLANPRITPGDKKAVVKKAFAAQLSPKTLNLMLLLIDKHRETDLLDIAARFSHLADLKRGVEKAEVISAVPLPADQLAKLTAEVQRFSRHNVQLIPTVDPDIIGGVILKLGDRVIDGSIRFRLQELRRTLQSATVH